MQRYRPGCSWCISHCLLQQAVEHSAFQPGYAPGYKQAVLGHTVTMAAAPCSGPPEYTCPPTKKVTLFAFVLKFICKSLQSKALQCILTEGLIKSQRRRNALKAPVKKKKQLKCFGWARKKILMAFKFIWKTDYRTLCKAQISELFPTVFTNIIKFYKIMNFHKKWHFEKASLALILLLSFDRIKCWNGSLLNKQTEMPTVRHLILCIYKLTFHSCFKFWHYCWVSSGNSFQKVLNLIYIIAHFIFICHYWNTFSFP